MVEPKYTLKTEEAILGPENLSTKDRIIKYGTISIVLILVLGSIVFKENLFLEMPWIAMLLLVFLVVKVIFQGARERVPSPIEIRFYEDYLLVYRDKRYYSKKVSRREFNKFFYKDISKIEYQKKSNLINIYGMVESIWYNYNKDGSIPSQPTYHKLVDGICYFYTSAAKNIDFVAEIENNSPIRVTIKEF